MYYHFYLQYQFMYYVEYFVAMVHFIENAVSNVPRTRFSLNVNKYNT